MSKKKQDTETQAQRGPMRGEVEAVTEPCVYRPRSQERGGLPRGLRRNRPCSLLGFSLRKLSENKSMRVTVSHFVVLVY